MPTLDAQHLIEDIRSGTAPDLSRLPDRAWSLDGWRQRHDPTFALGVRHGYLLALYDLLNLTAPTTERLDGPSPGSDAAA